MASSLRISPFMSMMIGLLFTFSTIYGLMYYFYQGESQTTKLENIDENGNNVNTLNTSGGIISSLITGAIDTFLSFLAWISPFALVRGAILFLSPADLYQVLDIFLLRPMSWSVSILTGNWLISTIMSKSEGT